MKILIPVFLLDIYGIEPLKNLWQITKYKESRVFNYWIDINVLWEEWFYVSLFSLKICSVIDWIIRSAGQVSHNFICVPICFHLNREEMVLWWRPLIADENLIELWNSTIWDISPWHCQFAVNPGNTHKGSAFKSHERMISQRGWSGF